MTKKIMWLCYEFTINKPDTVFESIGGIYMFCGINEANEWVPLYIDQASSLAERLANHERWSEAEMHGASHIHIRTTTQQDHRDRIEKHLIESYQPRMNADLRW